MPAARLVRPARRLSRTHILGAGLVVVVAAGVVLTSVQVPAQATRLSPVTASVQVASPPVAAAPRPAAQPVLPPVRSLISASVLITSERPLGQDDVERVLRATGANASLRVATGQVDLGRGTTRVLAGDPSKVRIWTPTSTGRTTGVWQRAAAGEAVLAHTVAHADDLELGGQVTVRNGDIGLPLRVGALATNQLPGVGLVLDDVRGEQLGLVAGTGLLLAVRGTDPSVVAAIAGRVLGEAAKAEPVLTTQPQSGDWAPPTIGRVTSPFGMRIHPITEQPQFHEGIDIGAPLGSPVYAMADGQVLYAGPASGFGQEIVLSHAGDVATVYGHVSQVFVTSGAVQAGQVIALVGKEGESTGPHLHAEVHIQDQPVDPVGWLSDHGVRFSR